MGTISEYHRVQLALADVADGRVISIRVVVVKADVHALLALPPRAVCHNRVVGRDGPRANAEGAVRPRSRADLRLSDEAPVSAHCRDRGAPRVTDNGERGGGA